MLFYNFILRLILEGYLEFTMTSFLNITNVSKYFLRSIVKLGDLYRLNVIDIFNNGSNCHHYFPFYHLDNSMEKKCLIARRKIYKNFWLIVQWIKNRLSLSSSLQCHIHDPKACILFKCNFILRLSMGSSSNSCDALHHCNHFSIDNKTIRGATTQLDGSYKRMFYNRGCLPFVHIHWFRTWSKYIVLFWLEFNHNYDT